jgi:hypothetical protein
MIENTNHGDQSVIDMNSGYNFVDIRQDKAEETWRKEKKCIDILNLNISGEKIWHHSLSEIYSQFDGKYRDCHIELEEKEPGVIKNDRYMFKRGLSALSRKVMESSNPDHVIYIIYGYDSDNLLFGYAHTYEKFKKDGIRQNFGDRKDDYVYLTKEKSGPLLNAQKLAERIKFLGSGTQLTLPMG